MLGDSQGQSKISSLIYLLVALLIVYVVVKTVPVYLRYYSMDDEVYHQIEMSRINNADTIRKDLIDKATELEIAIEPEDIELTYDENERLDIYMSWVDEADYGYGIVRDFEFTIDTSARKSEE